MHFYSQSERELLLMALLDISLDQFFAGGEAIEDLDETDPVNILGGNYVNAMQERDGQLMFQSVSQMSDETLHRFVWCFMDEGPLPFDPPRSPSEEMRLGVVFEDNDGEEMIVTPFSNALEADTWAKSRLHSGIPNAPVKFFVTPVMTPEQYDAEASTEPTESPDEAHFDPNDDED